MKQNTLEAIFERIAQELLGSFRTIREGIKHAPSKGQSVETEWSTWLSTHLPRRYGVGRGFVTAADGRQSLEQDIIIFDHQYSPLLFERDRTLFVPAESVYCVIEVKSVLTPAAVRDASSKIQSVRHLPRHPSQPVHEIHQRMPKKERGRIFGYVAAPSSAWAQKRVWPNLRKHLPGNSQAFIDGGCILDRGAFAVGKHSKTEITTIEATPARLSLLGFLGLVFEDLKGLATVPPWDFATYSRWIAHLRKGTRTPAQK